MAPFFKNKNERKKRQNKTVSLWSLWRSQEVALGGHQMSAGSPKKSRRRRCSKLKYFTCVKKNTKETRSASRWTARPGLRSAQRSSTSTRTRSLTNPAPPGRPRARHLTPVCRRLAAGDWPASSLNKPYEMETLVRLRCPRMTRCCSSDFTEDDSASERSWDETGLVYVLVPNTYIK